MELKPAYRAKLDAIGIGASLACAIHCILLPVFFTTLPFLGIEWLENSTLEIITVSISLLVGSLALLNGYRKHHRYIWPVLVFIIGIGCMLFANIAPVSEHMEMTLKFFGAGLIITAHGFNWKYCRRCAVCNNKIERLKTSET